MASGATPQVASPGGGRVPPARGRRGSILLAVAVAPLLRWLVIRHAVPVGEPWRRACDRCDLPVSLSRTERSALLPTGRCGRCGTRLGAPAFALEALLLAAVGVAVWAAPTAAVAGAGVWWSACAVALVFIDLRVHRLPDPLTYAGAIGVLAFLALDAVISGSWEGLLRAVLTAAGYGVAFLALALVFGRRGIGLGDAKLIVSLAALLGWWGPGAVLAAVFLAFVGSGLVGGVLLATGRVGRGAHIPMAPFLVTGTVAMLVLFEWLAV